MNLEKAGFNQGANPYLPLWEHVPDGEPRVFEYNGEKRVYIYGSHDTLKTAYCGKDQVVWSAPVDDLTNWRCDGVCYKSTDDSILYAPDVVQKGDTFYLYAAERCGSRIMVAKSKNPAGPFTDPVETELKFDPGILVDDDGRVYAYWGFCSCFCAELNDDMATIKKDTFIAHPMGHCIGIFKDKEEEHVDFKFGFFEASSPRKIGNKYIYIYSKRYDEPVPELGIYEACNGFLSYAYSDKPLGPWTYGGDISFNGGEIIKKEDGTGEMTFRWGNNHGSIMEVDGKWYVFYHRQTERNEYCRQAMLEPIDAVLSKDGIPYIGKVTYDAQGEPIAQTIVDMTSQGAHVNGLDAYKWTQAGTTCFLHGGSKKAYISAVYEEIDTISTPIMDITNGTTVGFRYIQFSQDAPAEVCVDMKALQNLTLSVHIDSYNGAEIARADIAAGSEMIQLSLTQKVIGKHAVYFTFESKSSESIAEFSKFIFG